MFNAGDTVALTGAMMLELAKREPEVFGKLMAAERTGGQIKHIEDDGSRQMIFVNFDDVLGGPLAVAVNREHPQLSLQLIKRAERAALEEPEEAAKMPVDLSDLEDGSAVFQYDVYDNDGNQVGPSQVGMIPPAVVEQIQQMAQQDAAAVGQRKLQQQQMLMVQQAATAVPRRVQLAQWAMTQFIQLKQYVIVQDLNRDDDDDAIHDVTPGDEWKSRGTAPVVRATLQLSEAESALYAAAMQKIQNWIEDDDEDAASLPLSTPPARVVPVPRSIPTPAVVEESQKMAEETRRQQAAEIQQRNAECFQTLADDLPDNEPDNEPADKCDPIRTMLVDAAAEAQLDALGEEAAEWRPPEQSETSPDEEEKQDDDGI